MEYTLRVTTTTNKAGKFLYEVFDENGALISTRRSNRKYVACTIDGSLYFGRIDLIGKGHHGKRIRYNEQIGREQVPIAYATIV